MWGLKVSLFPVEYSQAIFSVPTRALAWSLTQLIHTNIDSFCLTSNPLEIFRKHIDAHKFASSEEEGKNKLKYSESLCQANQWNKRKQTSAYFLHQRALSSCKRISTRLSDLTQLYKLCTDQLMHVSISNEGLIRTNHRGCVTEKGKNKALHIRINTC